MPIARERLPWWAQPIIGPERGPLPSVDLPDLDLPSTGEALGYGRSAWALIPYKQKSAILGAALLVARRHPVVAGATVGLAAIQAGRAIGVPERVAESGAAARRRLLPETMSPTTVPGEVPQPPPTVPEAVLERGRAGWRWTKKRLRQEAAELIESAGGSTGG